MEAQHMNARFYAIILALLLTPALSLAQRAGSRPPASGDTSATQQPPAHGHSPTPAPGTPAHSPAAHPTTAARQNTAVRPCGAATTPGRMQPGFGSAIHPGM